MSIPKTFYIKGHKWITKYKKHLVYYDGEPCYALCDPDKRIVWIDKDCTERELVSSFWHEYGHAILHSLHLVAPADGGMNETQEGVFCEGFADIMTNEWDVKQKRKKRNKN